jgi:hypothetical protein
VAAAIVTRVDELFAIDAEARRQALSLEARHALPQHNHDRSWMRYKKADRRRSTALPGGAQAKACNYVLTLWDKLTRFLECP